MDYASQQTIRDLKKIEEIMRVRRPVARYVVAKVVAAMP